MSKKFYDLDVGFGGGGVHVVNTENQTRSIVIECDCGTHMMKVQWDADIYTGSDNSQRINQTIYFAMFNYGNQKRNFWHRVRIAFNYLRTGKMFADQLSLTTDEAKKLSDFINDNIIPEGNE